MPTFRLLRLWSERAKKAFLIGEESEKTRDRYGHTSLWQGALLARRLVEAGVRYVTISRGFNTWDHVHNTTTLPAGGL